MDNNRDEYEDAKYTQDGRLLSMDQLDQLEGVDGVDQLDESLDAFANVGQGLDGDHRTEMLNYWQQAIDEIEHIAEDGNGHECFKSTALPLARIKKVMKTDSEVRMISAEAPILFAKGCDIFITELTMRAWIHAEENKRRTLQRSDIATAIQKSDVFDFLIDIVPREEAQQRKSTSHPRAPHSEGGNISNDPHTSQHPAGRQPREVPFVGDSRNMTMNSSNSGSMNNAMHNMNVNMNNVAAPGGYATGNTSGILNGMPNNLPSTVVPEGSMQPQQFAQYDNRFAPFQPQQFSGAVPPPGSMHQQPAQFNQFPPQYSGAQYIPQIQNAMPQTMPVSPHQIPTDPSGQPSQHHQHHQLQLPQQQEVQQRGQHQLMETHRPQDPTLGGSHIENDQFRRSTPSSSGEHLAQQSSQVMPQRQQQQHQQQRSPDEQHPESELQEKQQQQQQQQPPQQQLQHQQQQQQQQHEQQQSQPEQFTQQQPSSHPPPSPTASPQMNQKMHDQPRYDPEFQYSSSYREPVDVAFGPNY